MIPPTGPVRLASLYEPPMSSFSTVITSAPFMVSVESPVKSNGWPKPTAWPSQTIVVVPMPAAVRSP